MNKRIRELALEAGYRQDMFGIGHWDCQEFNNFVELMVKECAELVEEYTKPRAYDTYYNAAEQIKAHFGVTDTQPSSPVITVEMVKRLREETDQPLMECKKALYACEGDHELAKQWLLDQRRYRNKI